MPPEVTAVLLAAGSSQRMGRPKQLLPVNGRPAVRYCAETILAAGIMDVVVVIGPRGGEIEAALEGLPLRIVRNPDPSSDMAGSVRIGLNASDAAGRFVLICLADHPLVAVETMRMVLAEAARNPARIIIPLHHIDLDDEGIVLDMDTERDYAELRRKTGDVP
jgi:molybdenum cofactor cytidylyltransferase